MVLFQKHRKWYIDYYYQDKDSGDIILICSDGWGK